ncbi:MAG: hypothetical protein SNJ78_08290 [Spirochaetales bacterium]
MGIKLGWGLFFCTLLSLVSSPGTLCAEPGQGLVAMQGVGERQATQALEKGWQFSAISDTTVKSVWVSGFADNEEVQIGAEQFANIRLEAPLGTQGKVYVALNLLAASGVFLQQATFSPTSSAVSGSGDREYSTDVSSAASSSFYRSSLMVGSGYGSSLELERLYYRLVFSKYDWEAGLLRIPFGYGLIWRPMDFLNPPNPLTPDARPRGVLGSRITLYGWEDTDLGFFVVASPDPTRTDGAGSLGGVSFEWHGLTSSLQALYAVQMPLPGKKYPDHRWGVSYKWDGPVAFTLEGLYTLDTDALWEGRWYEEEGHPLRGLEATLGVDGSIGKTIWIIQYFYQGSLKAALDTRYGKHYLGGSLLYRQDDFTRYSLGYTVSLSDGSFVPLLSVEQEPFQGMTLILTFRLFLDAHALGIGSRGELGPLQMGSRGDLSLKVRIRF